MASKIKAAQNEVRGALAMMRMMYDGKMAEASTGASPKSTAWRNMNRADSMLTSILEHLGTPNRERGKENESNAT